MKRRALWFFIAFALLALAAAYWWPNQAPPVTAPGAAATIAPPAVAVPAATPTAAAAASTAAKAKQPKPEVAIQDGKTIDFSSGVAVVKDDAKQKAAIDKSVKEMESAAKDVTFGPPAQQKAEPTPAPPKP